MKLRSKLQTGRTRSVLAVTKVLLVPTFSKLYNLETERGTTKSVASNRLIRQTPSDFILRFLSYLFPFPSYRALKMLGRARPMWLLERLSFYLFAILTLHAFFAKFHYRYGDTLLQNCRFSGEPKSATRDVFSTHSSQTVRVAKNLTDSIFKVILRPFKLILSTLCYLLPLAS